MHTRCRGRTVPRGRWQAGIHAVRSATRASALPHGAHLEGRRRFLALEGASNFGRLCIQARHRPTDGREQPILLEERARAALHLIDRKERAVRLAAQRAASALVAVAPVTRGLELARRVRVGLYPFALLLCHPLRSTGLGLSEVLEARPSSCGCPVSPPTATRPRVPGCCCGARAQGLPPRARGCAAPRSSSRAPRSASRVLLAAGALGAHPSTHARHGARRV